MYLHLMNTSKVIELHKKINAHYQCSKLKENQILRNFLLELFISVMFYEDCFYGNLRFLK